MSLIFSRFCHLLTDIASDCLNNAKGKDKSASRASIKTNFGLVCKGWRSEIFCQRSRRKRTKILENENISSVEGQGKIVDRMDREDSIF